MLGYPVGSGGKRGLHGPRRDAVSVRVVDSPMYLSLVARIMYTSGPRSLDRGPFGYPDLVRCRATTKRGYRCPIGTDRASGLCHVHDPALQCRRLTKKGTLCTVATGGGPCERHRGQADDVPATLWTWTEQEVA